MNIYSTGHKHSLAVCSALARGTGLAVRPVGPLAPGGVAMYGFLRGLLPMLKQAQAEGRTWVYADRGYFRVTYAGDHSGHFRITRNGYQYRGPMAPDWDRFKKLELDIQPWRRDGRHILVCPPGDLFLGSLFEMKAGEWLDAVLADLRESTDREIRVRNKPAASEYATLADDLVGCHCLVTWMSNAAVEALVAGVPVCVLGPSAAQGMGIANIRDIESPVYPDNRPEWAATLAAQQFTLDEMRAGLANHLFRE